MSWFYNLKISLKLTISFLVIALIAGVVGIVGLTSIMNIDKLTPFYMKRIRLELNTQVMQLHIIKD